MWNRTARPWQFSLLTLLIAMAGVAAVCLALRSPNEFWATAVFVAALAGLALAALAAIYRDGRTRAFALGFLVVGAGYWGLVLLAERDSMYGQSRLPTTRWSVMLFSLLHQDDGSNLPPAYSPVVTYTVAVPTTVAPVYTPPPPGNALPSPTFGYAPQRPVLPQFSMQTFLDISQQSLVLILGVLGGIAAQWLYVTRRKETPERA